MDYQGFLDYVEGHIKEYLPHRLQDTSPEVITYTTDGQRQQGLILKQETGQGGVQASPAMRLRPVFSDMQEQGLPIGTAMRSMVADYLRAYEGPAFRLPDVSPSNIRANLYTVAVNYGRSDLKGIPYLKVNDLAVIAESQVNDDAAVTITDEIAKYLQMDKDQVLQAAIENNARLFPPVLMGMGPTNFMEESSGLGDLKKTGMDESPMWVLTNQRKQYGASFIADKGVLDRLADGFGGDYYLLPSSIHELIAVPSTIGLSARELQGMVKDVNSALLGPEEYLSDNVYTYTAASRELQMHTGEPYKEHTQAKPQNPPGPRI